MQLLILRKYDKEGTPGKAFINGNYFSRSLERPNLGNQRDNPKTKANDSSCIPEGEYTIVRDRTGKFRYFRVLDVPNRTNVEMHPCNSIDDLLACIGLGEDILTNKYGYKFWLTIPPFSPRNLVKMTAVPVSVGPLMVSNLSFSSLL